MSKGQENTLFQKNMEVYSKYYEKAAAKLNNKEYEVEKGMKVSVEYAYSGMPIFAIEKENVGKRYLAGKYAPEQAMLDWAEMQGKIYHESVYVIIGMGNVPQITKFLKSIQEKIYVVIYEPSVLIFQKVMEYYDIADLLENYPISLVVEGLNTEALQLFLNGLVHRGNMSLLKTYFSGNYIELFHDSVKNVMFTLKEHFNKITFEWNTRIKFTDVVGKNVLNNIAYFYHGYSAAQFKNILDEEVPVIIVSAGPSLNKNIDKLKLAQGKSCIIATDTAIKPLLNRGIYPDFVTIIDGKKDACLFGHADISKCFLLTCTTVSKDVMNLHQGKKMFYRAGDYFEESVIKKFNEKNNKLDIPYLPTGGSVANTAFSFALYLGAKTIILIGQDLALTGNKTHADGTFKEKMECIDPQASGYFEVESIDGGNVLTRPDFKLYLDWFENIIKELEKAGAETSVIDATEGGAKIHGAEIMTLQEAIEIYCKKSVNLCEKIKEVPEMLSENDKKNLLSCFSEGLSEMREVEKKVKEGIKLYEKMLEMAKRGEFNSKKYIDVSRKISKINNFMNTNDMALFVASNLEELEYQMIATMNFTKDDEQDEYIEIANKGMKILKEDLNMIKMLSETMEHTILDYHGDDSVLYARYSG